MTFVHSGQILHATAVPDMTLSGRASICGRFQRPLGSDAVAGAIATILTECQNLT
jgi:hypothetical protein